VIFQHLILQNFGLYRDRQVIDLTTPQPQQPIILIGGLNGRGKTTLLDAIRLALYGHRAPCSNRGSLSYPDFLTQCAHRHIPDQETALRLTLRQALNHRWTEIQIDRRWTAPVKTGKDSLTVYLDGIASPDWSDNWDDRIEALFPLGISNLFLFDGEQVKELAEQEDLPPGVIQAMRSLLGLELPDRLATDLEVLQRRKQKQIAGAEQQQQLEGLEQRLEALDKQKKIALDAQASLTDPVNRAVEQLRLAEERFLTEGGKIAAEKQSIQMTLNHLRQQAETHRQTLRNLAASSLPLALIQPLLHQAKEQIQQELQHQHQAIAQDILTAHNQRLLDYLHSLNLPAKYLSPIHTFLAPIADTPIAPPPYLHPRPQHLPAIDHLLTHSLPTQQQQAETEIQQLHALQNQIDTAERYLVSAASPEAYDKLQTAVRLAQTAVAHLKADYEQAQRQHEQVKQEIARTRQELLDYTQQAIAVKNTTQIIQAIAKVQSTLIDFRQQLKDQKLNHLSQCVTDCLHELLSKKDLVDQIQMDPDTFALKLFDQQQQPLQKHRLSAGEKQLLAIALLWGLARASGRQLPVAIDTPLGRLDSHHRLQLVDHYFPNASHQVILLSTDTEIRQEEVTRLRQQGAIAREYLLDYQPTLQQTEVNLGYFC